MGANHHNFRFHKKFNKPLKTAPTPFIFEMNLKILFKTIGFWLGVLTLLVVLGSVLTNSISKNALFVVGLLFCNLLLALVLPKLFPSNSIIHAIQGGLHSFGKKTSSVVTAVLLVFVYVTAVGPVWLISRITKKRFLPLQSSQSQWVKKQTKKINFDEMF